MKHSKESGFSLIEVIVCMGLMFLLMSFLSDYMLQNLKMNNHQRDLADRESIRMMLESQVGCAQSMPTACTPGALVSLKRKDGSTLVSSSSGKQFDRFVARAECDSLGTGIIIRAAKMKNPSITSTNTTDYLPDPLTNQVRTWSHPKTLLQPTGATICSRVVNERDLACVTGIRQRNTLTGDSSIFQMTGSTTMDWGIACQAPYAKSGCSISTLPDTATDVDLVMTDTGCQSDNEEWDSQHKLIISCCKLNR